MNHDSHDAGLQAQQSTLSPALRSSLRCPLSGQELIDGIDDAGQPALISPSAGLAYPVRDGVPILLVHEALRAPGPSPEPQA
ncbi:Trm112 family protein [Actinomyces sp. ZJ308]|uniref:Trm112 family protein n=1 Tax=Actinomyces sp. ZJ308 TaxID=2708342 RepID=UPI00141D762A|nr:Trm112 family protein [Actinomyces sp. ZJ308]